MDTVLVLPTQLFEDNKLISHDSHVYIYEHPVYFTDYNYHKLKLIMHRASMKYYQDYIKKKYKCKVTYLEYNDNPNSLFKNKRIDFYDPVDFNVMNDLKKNSKKNNTELFAHDTPAFLCTMTDLTEYFDHGGKFHQTSFYIWQRKRLGILITKDDKPSGGKWTYDSKNRLPFPKDFKKDAKFKNNQSKYINEAKKYIELHFNNNPGESDYYLPINHKSAKEHLSIFLKERLECFGPYQDAVRKDIVFGCHSVLSPLINIGLLTPKYVVDEIVKYKKIKLESLEGIIRQIIGWRDYMRMVYMFKHQELIKTNHFGHKRIIGKEWYNGETKMEIMSDLIKKVLKYGYAHHIERLMYLGNFMLLNEFKPKDIHDWFMCMFLDSYHVFMETNVYGMSQYACGPIMSTRPYFSSSNYISKMSNYKRNKDIYNKIKLGNDEYEWYEIWDALYYNFINNHKKEFSKNYAIASAVSHWNNKNKNEQNELLKIAKDYLKKY
ncbi:deoxyribodipyrimidine photolyase-related protein [Indivirus ILV1]|uniref:Deoxyribodipyrimidine photolyase-related protein n=1 Tax=Indivirus ILV1 TaxID=1977633 RepID=A0A1V0SE91_9VIRU|nr:deoxyribodipyrimidine photolyase-related protein [Indivirus ILV1]